MYPLALNNTSLERNGTNQSLHMYCMSGHSDAYEESLLSQDVVESAFLDYTKFSQVSLFVVEVQDKIGLLCNNLKTTCAGIFSPLAPQLFWEHTMKWLKTVVFFKNLQKVIESNQPPGVIILVASSLCADPLL